MLSVLLFVSSVGAPEKLVLLDPVLAQWERGSLDELFVALNCS